MRYAVPVEITVHYSTLIQPQIKKTMARISAKSALVLFLQVTVLILVLSPTANCLSLDDRAQLKQITEEFVRKIQSFFSDYSFQRQLSTKY